VTLSLVEDVAYLRLAGGKANAMDDALLSTIDDFFDRVGASGAAAVVVTGTGRHFSAGLAIPSLVGLDRAQMKRFIERLGETMLRVFTCPLPVIAAVNGHAVAGGCLLALQADRRIMVSEGAQIGLNEVQLGIGFPSVLVETLRFAVPIASLLPVALEGRLFAPPDALALGLVEELAPSAEVEARAHAWARRLAAVPASGFRQVKAALRRPVVEAVERANPGETERWLDSWFSDEARLRLAEIVRRLQTR
jgi:enoyl-CoA hydratase